MLILDYYGKRFQSLITYIFYIYTVIIIIVMLQLSKIYAIKPIRYSIKMAICLMGVKVCGDLFYWAISGQTVAFPRYVYEKNIDRHFSKVLLNMFPIHQS